MESLPSPFDPLKAEMGGKLLEHVGFGLGLVGQARLVGGIFFARHYMFSFALIPFDSF